MSVSLSSVVGVVPGAASSDPLLPPPPQLVSARLSVSTRPTTTRVEPRRADMCTPLRPQPVEVTLPLP